jgi:HD-like signal output (HDOD) protein
MPLTIDKLVTGVPSLGSHAEVIRDIESALNCPNSTLANLADAIEKDPDLAGRLLKLGNSAFFGFPNRLETVSMAISLIGIQQVRDLIVAANIIETFSGIDPEMVDMRSFWQHSLACGIGARALAIARQMPQPEKYFIAGLLHDLGRLVLLTRAPQKATEVFTLYQSRRMLLRTAEQEILGFDHAQIGMGLTRYWQYPASLATAVAYHHQPMEAGLHQLGSSVVHVADYLVHAMHMGNSGEHFVPPLDLRAWERLGLSTDMLDSVVKTIDEQIEAVEQSLIKPAGRTVGRAV